MSVKDIHNFDYTILLCSKILAACHVELVATGVPIIRMPTDLPEWRRRTLFFRDPEDNVIEIYAEY